MIIKNTGGASVPVVGRRPLEGQNSSANVNDKPSFHLIIIINVNPVSLTSFDLTG